MSLEGMENQNRTCLQDYALRLLCVLALDRFGDFVSDQVTAPVRETCAQALGNHKLLQQLSLPGSLINSHHAGALLKHMHTQDVCRVLAVILALTQREEWEVRHAGMLGLKYLVAVRKDLVETVLPDVLPAILRGYNRTIVMVLLS